MSKDLHFNMRQEELAHVLSEVENGNQRALPLYAEVKQLEALFTQAKKQLEPYALDEAMQYQENTFEENGIEYTKKNGATRYTYKNIPEWQEANDRLKEIEARSKQAFISKQKGILSATEDGEEIILPTVNYSKNSLLVKVLQKAY